MPADIVVYYINYNLCNKIFLWNYLYRPKDLIHCTSLKLATTLEPGPFYNLLLIMELNSALHMWSLNALRLVREVTHEPIDISMWVYVINMNLFFGNDCVLWRIKRCRLRVYWVKELEKIPISERHIKILFNNLKLQCKGWASHGY